MAGFWKKFGTDKLVCGALDWDEDVAAAADGVVLGVVLDRGAKEKVEVAGLVDAGARPPGVPETLGLGPVLD